MRNSLRNSQFSVRIPHQLLTAPHWSSLSLIGPNCSSFDLVGQVRPHRSSPSRLLLFFAPKLLLIGPHRLGQSSLLLNSLRSSQFSVRIGENFAPHSCKVRFPAKPGPGQSRIVIALEQTKLPAPFEKCREKPVSQGQLEEKSRREKSSFSRKNLTEILIFLYGVSECALSEAQRAQVLGSATRRASGEDFGQVRLGQVRTNRD